MYRGPIIGGPSTVHVGARLKEYQYLGGRPELDRELKRRPGCSAALRWYEIAAAVTPGCSVTWRREWDSQDQADALQPVVQAHLSWFNLATEEVVSMSCADAKLAFEHYIDWPSSLAELSLKIGALPRSDTLTAKDLEERIVKFVIDAFPESFRDRAPPRARHDVAD